MMSVVTENQKSEQFFSKSQNASFSTLLYVDPILLTSFEKEQLSLIFKFLKSVGNEIVCNKIFSPNREGFPCLIKQKSRTFLTVWYTNPLLCKVNNCLIYAKSYTEFINAVLIWIDKEYPCWLELLSKAKFVNNLPIFQSLINSKSYENQLQDQSNVGHRRNSGGSIIDGGRAEASITIKPLSNKAILG